ncbi:MAG TPA: sulfite exporter TauE/SafE family protein [Candidatus Hydrogenedentes bacterium]|nr:sulfite exporter TauE/SafE family protein [Candidatus Hydrogenedentota bacterium]
MNSGIQLPGCGQRPRCLHLAHSLQLDANPALAYPIDHQTVLDLIKENLLDLALSNAGMLVLGAAAGMISASLGLGGGIVMVPALIEFAHLDPHTAKGTSLFLIIFIAALNAWRLNHGYPDKHWRLGVYLACGSILGGYFGAWVTALMPGRTILWIFIGLLGVLGIRTFFIRERAVSEGEVHKRYKLACLIGFAAGVVSGMTGTGGGAVLVPLALLAGIVTNERVVGVSNMVMVATSIAATAAHLRAERLCDFPWTVGQVHFAIVPFVFIGAQIGSPWGKHINARLTLARRRVVLGTLLLILVARLLVRALAG